MIKYVIMVLCFLLGVGLGLILFPIDENEDLE